MKSLLFSLFSLPPGRRPGSPGAKPRGGFTLLELVAVIGIIAVMSVIVVSGYSGITRSLSAQAGTDTLKRLLLLARQQACVDGVDTYVWVTGVDSFVVVRRAGTVCHEPTTGRRKPGYLQTGGEFSVSSNWIVDDYADLGGASMDFRFDGSSTNEQKEKAIEAYASGENVMLVFDMDAAKTAVIEYPPFFDASIDAWAFGISSVPSGSRCPNSGSPRGSPSMSRTGSIRRATSRSMRTRPPTCTSFPTVRSRRTSRSSSRMRPETSTGRR